MVEHLTVVVLVIPYMSVSVEVDILSSSGELFDSPELSEGGINSVVLLDINSVELSAGVSFEIELALLC